jgi:hypothetical protein
MEGVCAVADLSPETLKSLLDDLLAKGVGLTLFNCMNAGSDEILRFLDDPVDFEAGMHGISKAEFERFLRHDWQCCAKAKSTGRRCKNRVLGLETWAVHWPPDGFDAAAGIYNYCRVHLGYR